MADVHTPSVRGRARFDQALARSRVPLGFVVGATVLWLARPTFSTLAMGGAIAAMGEMVRIWAAGHLEKASEVTRSGPYRFTRHPLYAGSALIGIGVVIASARWTVAALIAVYLLLTVVSAIRHEEANMRADFGGHYDAYVTSHAKPGDRPKPVGRRFSAERAFRNREYRAVVGLLAAADIFALKAARHL
jgi:protein-S-isoprenylcysteine O-methyltransferase Ste14